MSKRVYILLALGIMVFLSGMFLRNFLEIPKVFAIILASIGGGTISATIMYHLIKRGNLAIRDEMVMRVESLSGNYTTVLTLYFIIVLSIVHFFHPLQLSVSGLLLTMMMFMSWSYIIIRYFLMKWGKAE